MDRRASSAAVANSKLCLSRPWKKNCQWPELESKKKEKEIVLQLLVYQRRGAIAGGGERSKVNGSDRSRLVEGSGLRWRGAIAVASGGDRSLLDGRDHWWRGPVSSEPVSSGHWQVFPPKNSAKVLIHNGLRGQRHTNRRSATWWRSSS